MLESRSGVTEPLIREMVERFYTRVHEDDLLGPVFERELTGSWSDHLDHMVDFWSSVLLASGRFRGNPRARHHAIQGLRGEHFDRWLALFEDVLREVYPQHAAEDILWRARRMRLVLDPDATHETPVLSTTRTMS